MAKAQISYAYYYWPENPRVIFICIFSTTTEFNIIFSYTKYRKDRSAHSFIAYATGIHDISVIVNSVNESHENIPILPPTSQEKKSIFRSIKKKTS